MIKDIEAQNDSKSINEKEIKILKKHFPACFSKDGTFDLERFKEAISNKVDITQEGYELKFLGKSYAKLLVSLDTTTVITPNVKHNTLSEHKNSNNIYISGDNLDGLQHLLKSYSNKVKCIYIDPPYNTGNDGFVYNDSFNFSSEDLQHKLSVEEEEAQRILDLTNNGSASHSAWLLFMYPRLQLAKDLLKDDGFVFISIDDNELSNLKLLCDDIFGEENFLGQISRLTGTPTGQGTKGLVSEFDYILLYSASGDVELFGLPFTDKDKNIYNQEDEFGKYLLRPLRKTGGEDRREDRPSMYFSIKSPNGDDVFPIGPKGYESRWRCSLKKYNEFVEKNLIEWKDTQGKWEENKTLKPYLKFYLEGRLKQASNLWKDIDGNKKASVDLNNLFGDKIFDHPKPVALVKRCFEISSDKDDLFLDFFSGSASSAQAVLELNSKDNGNRKFIAVQLPEVLNKDEKSQSKTYNFLKSVNRPTTLDYVGIERIIRASKKIKEETKADIDYGFKHYILNEPNQNTLDKCETFDKASLIPDGSILEDFGVETVLTTWLNYDGYGLNVNAEILDLDGYTAYYYNKHLYLINPDFTKENVVALFEKYEAIGSFNPENVILFGYSFNEWSVTEMLEQNLKILNDTEKNLKININVRY